MANDTTNVIVDLMTENGITLAHLNEELLRRHGHELINKDGVHHLVARQLADVTTVAQAYEALRNGGLGLKADRLCRRELVLRRLYPPLPGLTEQHAPQALPAVPAEDA